MASTAHYLSKSQIAWCTGSKVEMLSQNIRIRKVQKSDLSELRNLILPEFNPIRRKLLWTVAKDWKVQIFLLSMSALVFGLARAEATLLVLVYMFLNAATLSASAIIFRLRLMNHNKDLWDWDVCKNAFTQGLWVAEVTSDEGTAVVGSFCLDKPSSITVGEEECVESLIEIKRLSVAEGSGYEEVGARLLTNAIARAVELQAKSIACCVPESSERTIKLCKLLGFQPFTIHNGLIKVHVLKKDI